MNENERNVVTDINDERNNRIERLKNKTHNFLPEKLRWFSIYPASIQARIIHPPDVPFQEMNIDIPVETLSDDERRRRTGGRRGGEYLHFSRIKRLRRIGAMPRKMSRFTAICVNARRIKRIFFLSFYRPFPLSLPLPASRIRRWIGIRHLSDHNHVCISLIPLYSWLTQQVLFYFRFYTTTSLLYHFFLDKTIRSDGKKHKTRGRRSKRRINMNFFFF